MTICSLTNCHGYVKIIPDVIPASSMAERSAVNRNVGGSSPPRGVFPLSTSRLLSIRRCPLNLLPSLTSHTIGWLGACK